MKSLAFLLLLATPVSALSCLQPDPVTQYTYARDSEDVYGMVIGRIEPYGKINEPKQDLNGNKTDTTATTRVRLTGRSLTAEGFTGTYDADITLNLACLSVWCPGAPATDTEIFATLRHDGEARVLDQGPCHGNALPWSADAEARVLNCHRFGKCEAPN